jgi:hypothetical protein
VSINVPEWDGRAKEAGEVWRLRKGKKEAVCTLWSHPMGCQARVNVGKELWRYEAQVEPAALIDLALEWKWQFQEKGWKPEDQPKARDTGTGNEEPENREP